MENDRPKSFESRLLTDAEFLKRVEKARRDIREGKGVTLETLRKQAEQEARRGAEGASVR